MNLSPDGSRVAFPVHEGHLLEDSYTETDLMVCDVASCAETSAFSVRQTYGELQEGGTYERVWGKTVDGFDRLFFLYRHDAGVSGGDLVAIDSDAADQWSEPVVIVANPSVRFFAPAGRQSGAADCVVFTSRSPEGIHKFEIVEVPHDLPALPLSTTILDATKVSGSQATWNASPGPSCTTGTLWISETDQNSTISEVDISGPTGPTATPTGLTGFDLDSAL